MNCVNEAPFKIMARRKGEMTEGAIDRDYPHHVELRADLTTDKNSDAALAFCRGLTLALRGHHRRKGDIDRLHPTIDGQKNWRRSSGGASFLRAVTKSFVPRIDQRTQPETRTAAPMVSAPTTTACGAT
jgi:hypothetical protein